MTQGEIAVTVIPLAFTALTYLYVLHERRKLIAARERRRNHPAE